MAVALDENDLLPIGKLGNALEQRLDVPRLVACGNDDGNATRLRTSQNLRGRGARYD